MKRWSRNFRDDRCALTTLQNPNLEVRTYVERVQAAQRREIQQPAAPIPATQPPSTPNTQEPDPLPATLAPLNKEARSVHPTTKSEVMFSTQRLPAVAGLSADRPANRSAHSNGEQILIASGPNIKK
jgi:hypothetical protein